LHFNTSMIERASDAFRKKKKKSGDGESK